MGGLVVVQCSTPRVFIASVFLLEFIFARNNINITQIMETIEVFDKRNNRYMLIDYNISILKIELIFGLNFYLRITSCSVYIFIFDLVRMFKMFRFVDFYVLLYNR